MNAAENREPVQGLDPSQLSGDYGNMTSIPYSANPAKGQIVT
jgi:hypothetical protein